MQLLQGNELKGAKLRRSLLAGALLPIVPHPALYGGAALLLAASAIADARQRKDFVMGLCNHGVLLNSRGLVALSTPVGDAEVDEFLEAVDTVLTEARARG